MIPVTGKPNITINLEHTIIEHDSIIPHDLCDIIIRDALDNNLQRGKSKNEHLWKAQFDSTLILNENHLIYKSLNNFWNEFVNKTGTRIDFIEYYEVKKYSIGDYFEPHRDNYFVLDDKIDRKLNLIVQLSARNDYTGGDLLVGDRIVCRNKGSLILFPATYIHQVTKITKGERYSLIGHAWGPNWI